MFYRRGSVVVPTAPYVVHHPWQVEWAKGSELKCFVGIVSDTDIIANEEYKPRKFPEKIAMSMAVTQHGMSQRSLSQGRVKMHAKPYATGAKTGSVVIRIQDDFGRCDQNNSAPLDEQKGYASWNESMLISSHAPDSVYLILHKDGSFWYLSWVQQADLDDTDIRIAVIKKHSGKGLREWSLLQLWKSDLSDTSDKTEFKVSQFLGDYFKINSGHCTFMQYPTNLNVDSNGDIQGDTHYIFYYPNGQANHGMIKVDKPTVWAGSISKSDPFTAPASPNTTPSLNDDYFFLDKNISNQWSIIIGHPVPSQFAPSIYIVPRSFAQNNLMVDVWKPAYGLIAVIPDSTGPTYTGGSALTGPLEAPVTATIAANPTLEGDLTDGYYLEDGGTTTFDHFHSIPSAGRFSQLEGYWTQVAFRGVVLAHADWDSGESKWNITQYHTGSVIIPNSDADLNYVRNVDESAFADWFTDTVTYGLNDYFWSTSYMISQNIGSMIDDAGLMWQDCDHMGNASIASRLIKY